MVKVNKLLYNYLLHYVGYNKICTIRVYKITDNYIYYELKLRSTIVHLYYKHKLKEFLIQLRNNNGDIIKTYNMRTRKNYITSNEKYNFYKNGKKVNDE